ncbi:MAG: alcohol dehydrogenase catalytic domain-containing protein [Phycisphaerae bacterium]
MSDKSPTMRAGIFLGVEKMEVREADIPTPKAGEVLLKVRACGVCGTDFHIYSGHLTAGVEPPVVLGHEIAAEVVETGEGVDRLDIGQFCAVDPVIGCGQCRMCRSAKPNLCDAPSIIGYKLNGGFAQYLTAPASKVVPLDASVGPAGGVLCETLACVLNGYERLQPPTGADVLILGAGTVGLLWLQVMRNSPVRRIVVTEPVAFRREKAERLGADGAIDPSAERFAEILAEKLPEGANAIVDATGDPSAVEGAIPLLAPGGTFMVFGVCPAGSSVRFDPAELYEKQARIIASKMPPATLDKAGRLIEAGRIPCDELVTDTRPLDALANSVAGFNDHRNNQIKVAIDPWR